MKKRFTIALPKQIISILLSFTVLLSFSSVFAQPGSMSNNTDFNTGYSNQSMTLVGTGSNNAVFTLRGQANATTSSGTKFYQFNSDGYFNVWNLNTPTYNAVSTAVWGTGGYNGTIKMGATTSGSYYTFNIRRGTSYANQSMSILETSYSPQNISSYTTPTAYSGQTPTMTVTLASTLSTNEYVYVAYSTDAFATSGNSGVLTVTSSASSVYTFTMPAYVNGTVVTFYPFTSTSSSAPSYADAPILTLNMRSSTGQNNTGSYSIYTVLAWTTASAGAWTSPATWNATAVPPTTNSMGTVTIGHNVTLDQAATVSSITINSGVTLTGSDGSARTLTIANGGTLTNNSTASLGYAATSNGTVVFSGGGTIGGTQPTSFNIVQLNGAITGSFSLLASGTAALNGTSSVSGTVTTVGAATFNGTAGASTLTNLTLNGAATLTKVSTVNGTLQFNSGASVSATQTYGASATLLYNGTSFTTTSNEWPTTSGPTNVTISAGSSNVVTLNSNKTVSGTLTLNTGSLDINATTFTLNSGSSAQSIAGNGSNAFTINSTGAGIVSLTGSGSHTITVSNFGTSVSGGLVFGANVTLQMNSSAALDCGGTAGTSSMVTIVNKLQLNSVTNSNIANSRAPYYTSAATLEYKVTYGVFDEWKSGTASTTPGVPNHVTIDATSSTVTMPASARNCLGNLTITNGTFALNGSNTLSVGGNWLRQNSSSTVFTTNTGTVILNGTAAQTIQVTGSGTNTSTHYGLTINNTSGGVSLSSPVNVSNLLTLTSGIVTTTATNILTITATTTGSISGGSTTTHISGPLVRTLPASTSGTANYTFPTGKSGSYLPFAVVDPTTGTGTVTVTSEAFATNSSGTPDFSTVYDLSTTEYWSFASAGNFTSSKISLTRTAAVSPLNLIASSSTSNGTYALIGTGGTPSSGTITTTGTVTGGTTKYVTFALSTPSGPYTVADGDWNSPAIWTNPASVPAAGTTVTILNAVTVNSAVTNAPATIQISSAKSVTIGASGTITATTVTNGGTLAWGGAGTLTIASGGTLTNNNTFTRSNGNLTFAGSGNIAGTLTLNNLTVNGVITLSNAVTVDGTLQINTSGGISTNTPIYTANSTLKYNSTSNPYSVNTEWTGTTSGGTVTAGTGIPQNVTVSNTNNVNLPAERGLAGTLLISSGTFTLNGTSGDLYIGGDFTQNSTYNSNGRSTIFNGSSAQNISGSGTISLNYLSNRNSSSGGLTISKNLSITSTTDGLRIRNSGPLNIASGVTVDLIAGANILADGATGGTTKTINFNAATSILKFNGTGSVTSTNSGTLTFTSTVSGGNVQINGGTDFGSSLTTIGNNAYLIIQTGGFVNTNPPTYGSSSTLIYNTGGTYGRSAEWNTTSGAGYPANVQIGNGVNTILNVVNGANSYKKAAGNLTVSTGSTFAVSDLTSGTGGIGVEFLGDINNDGTISLNGGSNTTSQRLKAANFNNGVAITNGTSTATVNLSGAIGGDMELTGNYNDNAIFNANSRAVFFTGSNNVQTIGGNATGTFNIDYMVVTKTASGGSVQLLKDLLTGVPNGGNGITLTSSANDILDLNGKTFTLGTALQTCTIAGNGFIRGSISSSMIINGTGDATGTLKFETGNQTLASLTVNRTSTGILTLGTDLTIATALTLSNGTFNIGSNTLTLNGTVGLTSGSIGAPTGTVTFNGGSAQSVPASVFTSNTVSNLNISNTNRVTFNGSAAVSGTMTVNGLFTPVAAAIISGAGTVTGTGTIQVTRATGSTDFNSQYTITNRTLTNLTTEFIGAAAQGAAANTFGGLKINNSSGVSLSGSVTVNGALSLASGKLSIGSNILTLNGTFSGSASNSLTGSTTSNISIGGTGTLGTLFVDAANNSLNNLTINRSTSGLVTLGNALNLTGILTPTAGTLASGGYLTLKSTSIINSAIVAQGSGTVTGNVTAERFIPTNSNGVAQGRRAFRDLSPGVITTQSVFDAWQEGGSNVNGYGTQITGVKGTPGQTDATTGLDYTISGSKSMYSYNINTINGAATWDAITDTKNTIPSPFKGYRLLVRGDRANNLGADASLLTSAATLRPKGQLISGTVIYNNSSVTANGVTYTATTNNVTSNVVMGHDVADAFTMIGNPYISPIDWVSIAGNNSAAVKPSIYIWDPNIGTTGAYVTYNSSTGSSNGGSQVNRYIQPGQAFFIQRNGNATPYFEIREADKFAVQADSTLRNVFGEGNTMPVSKIRFTLLKTISGSQVNMDGAVMCYRPDFSNEIGREDAQKIDNSSECLAINSHAKLYSIEGRAAVATSDSIGLKLYYTTNNANYQLNVDLTGFTSNGSLQPYLKDRFTKTITPLTLGTQNTYGFVTTADSSSYNNRFTVVFGGNTVLPIGFTSVKAYSNTNTNGTSPSNTIEWTANEAAADYYEVEHSSNGQVFASIGRQAANGNGLNSYSYSHQYGTSGNNYYRIKGMDKSGRISYSATVLVNNSNSSNRAASVSVYPNPIANGVANVHFSNMVAGSYTVTIHNIAGQRIYQGSIAHNGYATASYALGLPNKLAQGVYSLTVGNGSSQFKQQLIVK